MLGTRERSLLLERLRPPPGYRLRRAVGTTYTLDLIALLTAPLAFTFFDAHDEDGSPSADPIALLEALRRNAEKVTIFCQAGAISVPKPEQKLLTYLEGCVVEVQPRRGGGIFHPKVWVLNFEKEDQPAIYRVLCLSRNLSFARAWDTCLCLDGELTKRQRGFSRNKPLADLLQALPELTATPLSVELCEEIDRMACEVRRTDFQPPAPFTDFRIHHFGLWQRRQWPFPAAERSLVVSPFLVGSTVGKLVREHSLEILVSRPEAFDGLLRNQRREALPRTCYVLSSGANLESREADEESEAQMEGSPPVQDQAELAGLHAKLFLFENGREARLFTGSANATSAAFQQNVEVLVELFGRKKDCGIGSFLGQEDNRRLESLRALLQEYHFPASNGNDKIRRRLEDKADRLARRIGAARLIAKLHEVEEARRWDIALTGKLPEICEEAEVSVWPVTLSADSAVLIDGAAKRRYESCVSDSTADAFARFSGLSFEAITGFFAFEVRLREEGQDVRQRFAVTAELEGAPEDRKERLLRTLLKDSGRVLRLLLLILMDEGADVSAFAGVAGGEGAGPEGGSANREQTALLEALLQCLSGNPARIDEIARLIADLGSTPEGKELLPDGLNEIWEPVFAAWESMRP